MFKNTLLVLMTFALFFTLSACEESELNQKISLKINPNEPLVINADTVDRITTIVEGEESIEIIPVPGPWMSIGFDFKNDSDRTITIVALTIFVTGPDGETRTSNIFRLDKLRQPTSIFATIRAENDVDCDGIVDDTEKQLIDPELTPCELDDANPSFLGIRALISDLLSGVTDIENFRSASYQVVARFEGWVGGPLEVPEENFLKEVSFNASTN